MKSIKRKGYLLVSAAINGPVATLSLLTVLACILGLGPRAFSQQTSPPTAESEISLAERLIATPTDAERTVLLNSNGSLVNSDLAREIREAVVKGLDKAAPAESLRNLKLGLSVAE